MKNHQATPEEILEEPSIACYIRGDTKIRYRHFVREAYSPRAKNGVSHRQYSRSKIYVVDGKPHVRYHGELTELTGTFYELDSGRTFIADLRIKSEYLR